MRYIVFQTAWGWVALLGTARRLKRLSLPRERAETALRELGDLTRAHLAPGSFGSLPERLQGYFQGESMGFSDLLDLSEATPFQGVVWEAARAIPWGVSRSYAWLAQTISRPGASRAVGQALARNPLPILIPCHRVVAADGGSGGWSGPPGLKERLLAMEMGRRPVAS